MTEREQRQSIWHDLLERRVGRRGLMVGATAAGLATALPLDLQTAEAATVTNAATVGVARTAKATQKLPFTPITPSTADALVLPSGFRADLLAHRGHDMGDGTLFGENADFTAFFPIDMLEKGVDKDAAWRGFSRSDLSSSDGLLLVNHEYVNPLFISSYSGSGPKSAEQISAEQAMVGMSVIRVRRRDDGTWYFDQTDTAHNRRIDARTRASINLLPTAN